MDTNEYSTKHPNDEEPMLDGEGRCLVCSRLYLTGENKRLSAANERLRAERDAHLHSYNEALRTVAALARNAGGEVRLPDSALREVEGHVEVSHDYGTSETVIRGK